MKIKHEKKQEIFRVAARLLKEYGYDGTTYQMIADALGISKSIIAYHFKSKPLLVSYIFEEYVKEIDAYIKANITDGFNTYLYYCILHICLYREILKNNRNKELFFHKDFFKLWLEEKLVTIENYFQDIADEFNIDLTKDDIRINAVINQGAKISLFNEYIRNPGFITEHKLCYTIAYMIGILSRLDESTILRNLMRANDFIENHAYPKIDMLN